MDRTQAAALSGHQGVDWIQPAAAVTSQQGWDRIQSAAGPAVGPRDPFGLNGPGRILALWFGLPLSPTVSLAILKNGKSSSLSMGACHVFQKNGSAGTAFKPHCSTRLL